MPNYSRDNPSPRYREMEAIYQQMHIDGDTANAISADDTFDGRSLMPHIQVIGDSIAGSQRKTLLDYGCGKANAYARAKAKMPDGQIVQGLQAIWHLDEVRLYDPGFAPYRDYPTGTYDAVISTDVLEHITAEDMDWVVGEILGFARKFVFLNIACYPAKKILPNGENAHITQQSPGWWLDLVGGVKRPRFDHLTVFLVIEDRDRKRVFIEL